MLTQVGQSQLAQVPHLEQMRRMLLEKALAFYERFMREKGDDPAIQLETGMAYRRVGDIQSLLGQFEKAEAAYDHGIERLRRTIAQSRGLTAPPRKSWPACTTDAASCSEAILGIARRRRTSARPSRCRKSWRPSRRPCRATAWTWLAVTTTSRNVMQATARPQDAENAYRQALHLDEQLIAEFPAELDYRKDLAKHAQNLATLLVDSRRHATPNPSIAGP